MFIEQDFENIWNKMNLFVIKFCFILLETFDYIRIHKELVEKSNHAEKVF